MTFIERRHLISRAGIGSEWDAIQQIDGMTQAQAVQSLLRRQQGHVPPPPKMTSWNVRQNMYESGNPNHKMQMHKMTMIEGERLKQWWLDHMLSTKSPLLEKMTLFWHSHFTSSLDKVEQPGLIYKQNQTLRKHAMGNFAAMLSAMAKDPAMIIYLDGHLNEKGKPNENFARELLELFTVGHGRFSEHDVKQVAKAFTGWGVNRYNETYVFNQKEHDTTPKTVLGKRVNSGEEVLRVLLEHPATSVTIAKKMWRFFVSDSTPDLRVVNSWANTFRDSRYDIKALLKEVLNSKEFWAEENRGTLTKSPVDLVIGTMRAMPFKRIPTNELTTIFRSLGQDLFDPPNVAGWSGGQRWIDSQTLLVRTSLLNKLTGGNLNDKVNKGHEYPDTNNKNLQEWILAQNPVAPLPTIPGKVRLIRALTLDPMYQLT